MALQAVRCRYNKQTNDPVAPLRSVLKRLLLPTLSRKVSVLAEEGALLLLIGPPGSEWRRGACSRAPFWERQTAQRTPGWGRVLGKAQPLLALVLWDDESPTGG